MSAATDGQSAKKKLFDRGSWPEAVAALAAVLTLVGGVIGFLTKGDDKPAPAPVVTTAAGTTPALNSSQPLNSSRPTVDSSQPVAGTFLDSLKPVGGQGVPLPPGLNPADHPRVIAVGCPTNQTNDKSTTLKYALYKRYRSLTATVTGWSRQREPFRVQVQALAITTQADGQPQREIRGTATATVNEPGATLTVDLLAAGRSGAGADELELTIVCDQPNDTVILTGAQLS